MMAPVITYPPLSISVERADELRRMVARELGIDWERVCIAIALTPERYGEASAGTALQAANLATALRGLLDVTGWIVRVPPDEDLDRAECVARAALATYSAEGE